MQIKEKALYFEAVPIEQYPGVGRHLFKRRREGSFNEDSIYWDTPQDEITSRYSHWLRPTQATPANEGAEMREAFEVTHRKFNALVKAMIKDGLLPEIQIDECCRILEANNKLLFNAEI